MMEKRRVLDPVRALAENETFMGLPLLWVSTGRSRVCADFGSLHCGKAIRHYRTEKATARRAITLQRPVPNKKMAGEKKMWRMLDSFEMRGEQKYKKVSPKQKKVGWLSYANQNRKNIGLCTILHETGEFGGTACGGGSAKHQSNGERPAPKTKRKTNRMNKE